MTGTDHTPSLAPIVAPGAPGPSRPVYYSAPDLGAAAEGGGGVKPTLGKEKDATYCSLATREVSIAATDLPPQSPSPPPISDVAVSRRSQSSLDAEHTIDHPSHPLHGQFDGA